MGAAARRARDHHRRRLGGGGRGGGDRRSGGAVRLRRSYQGRCGERRRRCPREDRGEGRRQWRRLDLGTVRSFIEAEAPLVLCSEHGVVVAWVPWARDAARHTLAFDDTVAWLAVRTAKTAVTELLRISWPVVGRIDT